MQGYDDVHGETSFPWHTVEAAAPERTGWRILDKRLRAKRECSAFSRHVSDNPVTGHEHVQRVVILLYCFYTVSRHGPESQPAACTRRSSALATIVSHACPRLRH